MLHIEDLAGFSIEDSSTTSTSKTTDRYEGYTHTQHIQYIFQEDTRLDVPIQEVDG